MSVYTRPMPSAEPDFLNSSPGLIFQKWQAWDKFTVDKKFDRTDSRLLYLQKIAESVQNVYQNSYAAWRGRYLAALEKLGVDASIQYPTVWRLLVGWGSNPTLEAGMTLHHLYGFPYIPGSAVKGLLHHVAEMEVMDILPAPDLPVDQEKLSQALQQLQFIKILFGSIHLEQGLNKRNNKREFGPECPRPRLEKLKGLLQKSGAEWKETIAQIRSLLDENTGGLLCFYDAVPAPDQPNLLQTDIVNCHYTEYYGSEGSVPPSDDQNPIPVTFLAVRPGAEFIFPFRLGDWPVTPGRDKEEEQRLQILHAFTQQSVIAQVKTWLQKALGEYGVGAKTAAGYGYFDTGIIQMTAMATPAAVEHATDVMPSTDIEEPTVAVKPGAFTSNVNPASKISGVRKDHNPALWQRVAASAYLKKIEGKTLTLNPFAMKLPARKISENGKTMQVFYQNEKFFCEIELKLQGVKTRDETQYIWENEIFPELLLGA